MTASTGGADPRGPEHTAWRSMRRRCGSPTHRDYARMQARGITVWPAWAADFARFFADVGPRPGPGWALARRDPDQGYTPANTCWAPRGEAVRTPYGPHHTISAGGETLPLCAWARRLGRPACFITNRLEMGWSEAEAVLTPPGRRGWRRSKVEGGDARSCPGSCIL